MSDLFLGDRAPIDAQVRCVEREIEQRKRVYPRLVANGRMSQKKADYEIAMMTQVLRTMKALNDD